MDHRHFLKELLNISEEDYLSLLVIDVMNLQFQFMHYLRENTQILSHGEMAVLSILLMHGEALSPSFFAQKCSLSTARVANLLKILEKKEAVERVAAQDDKRCKVVKITEKGKEICLLKHRQNLNYIKNIFASLSREDSEQYLELLKKIVNSCNLSSKKS